MPPLRVLVQFAVPGPGMTMSSAWAFVVALLTRGFVVSFPGWSAVPTERVQAYGRHESAARKLRLNLMNLTLRLMTSYVPDIECGNLGSGTGKDNV